MIAWLPALIRFAPPVAAAAGIAVAFSQCSAKSEIKGELSAVRAELLREEKCEERSFCKQRAVIDVAAMGKVVADRTEQIRQENERRVADAVARYMRAANVERARRVEAEKRYEEQKQSDASCAVWASERVGCIVRPLGESGTDHETGGGGPSKGRDTTEIQKIMSDLIAGSKN